MGKARLIFLLLLGSCQYSPAVSTASAESDASASVETIRHAGMSYLVVSSPHAIAIVNLTKDSIEVLVRKRNEKYLELANRQFSVMRRP